MTRDPFGAAGDFTTSPEISQMFGELIGVWAAETWLAMGKPKPVMLIELGPGRGTLMSDALRAARVAPVFRAAIDVRLVETSPTLAAIQRETLLSAGAPVSWAQSLGAAPDGPAIIIANEFLDALPIRQFMFARGAWRERLVGRGRADGDGGRLRRRRGGGAGDQAAPRAPRGLPRQGRAGTLLSFRLHACAPMQISQSHAAPRP